MTEPNAPPSNQATKRLVLRSVKLPVALAACFLIVALAVLSIVAWRGMEHLEPVDRHFHALTRLQQVGLKLEELTIRGLNGGELPERRMEALREEIAEIIALDSDLVADTPRRLVAAQTAMNDFGRGPKQSLLAAIEPIRQALAAEALAHATLLAEVRRDLIFEASAAGAAVVVLSIFGFATLVVIRRRVLRPLATLGELLSLMARRDYTPAPTEGVDPIILPLTDSYNDLVTRLVELEKENAQHSAMLEHKVRTATEALLAQHRSLAVAERLAATGEMAARIAHELRNPLAGMQMALSNIRADCEGQTDVAQRMGLVIDELRRVTGLLNGLLDQSRIVPEPLVDCPIARIVADLFAVVRYQVPRHIELDDDISEDLVCRLPRDGLRQAVLNLVLNSAQAIGDRNGRILVRAVAGSDGVELSVRDDGPGFPEDVLRDGIGAFRTARSGGTGLGLSIVSRLVRNLEGRMEILNVEPHGACVRLMLPCRGAHA